ncbi:MAG: hypothetical protein DI582_04430 [Azospirillum brasilense]|nr:MAG: hypothetical protein DI582_04430 [Azospirillum brasilense]
MFQYEVFRAQNGQWAWRLKAGNGRYVAWSGDTYHNKQDVYHSIQLVKTNAMFAQTREFA